MNSSSINSLNNQKNSLISLLVYKEKIIEFSSLFAFQVGMPA